MVCGKEFNSANALMKHEDVSGHVQGCQCEVCGAQFSSDSQLEKHYKKTAHNEPQPPFIAQAQPR